MSPNQSIFRAYDIRGIYPQDLNEKTAYQAGGAFAIYLKENEKEIPEKILIGYDARLSSQSLLSSFISGVVSQGVDAWDIGMVTVDAVYFASGYFHLPAAMITASHNPKEWNGFKFMKSNTNFFDVKVLEAIINSGSLKNATVKNKGEIMKEEIGSQYVKHALSFTNPELIKPMRIAIDTSNGSVGPWLKLILEKLPVEYAAINFNPNGEFPNHDPNPVKEKNLTDLINKVNFGHYHFGCAFDGDGDRIIFVDENGEMVSPSIIGALMASYLLKQNLYGKIIYSSTTSHIIEDIALAYNGEAIREKVGHTHIAGRMRAENGILGIETSGHYFFKDNFYADSGIISFLIMLNILSGEKKSLSVLVKEFSKYVSTPEINFSTQGGSASGGKIINPENFIISNEPVGKSLLSSGASDEISSAMTALIKKIAQNFEGYKIDWLDGLTVTTPDFWFNLRFSNTEPILRLNIESKDEIILNRVKKDLTSLIKNYAEVDIL